MSTSTVTQLQGFNINHVFDYFYARSNVLRRTFVAKLRQNQASQLKSNFAIDKCTSEYVAMLGFGAKLRQNQASQLKSNFAIDKSSAAGYARIARAISASAELDRAGIADAPATSQLTIADIPPELYELFARCIRPEDRCSLIATCRHIRRHIPRSTLPVIDARRRAVNREIRSIVYRTEGHVSLRVVNGRAAYYSAGRLRDCGAPTLAVANTSGVVDVYRRGLQDKRRYVWPNATGADRIVRMYYSDVGRIRQKIHMPREPPILPAEIVLYIAETAGLGAIAALSGTSRVYHAIALRGRRRMFRYCSRMYGVHRDIKSIRHTYSEHGSMVINGYCVTIYGDTHAKRILPDLSVMYTHIPSASPDLDRIPQIDGIE
jgi:hypothetical protein